MALKTEDEVRNEAGAILGFTNGKGVNIENADVISGVGQLTTFIELGKRLNITKFSRYSDKPDGWYLPVSANGVAIILEAKSEKEDLSKEKWEKELFKNIDIVSTHYSNVIGLLYNGKEVRVFIDKEECHSISKTLQKYSYYTRLLTQRTLDKKHIYEVTQTSF